MSDFKFISRLERDVESFMAGLKKTDAPGRYFSCASGQTRHGARFELGTSCFALKIFYTFGWWKLLSNDEQKEWIRYIESFVLSEKTDYSLFIGAYADKTLLNYLSTPSLSRSITSARLSPLHKLYKIKVFKHDDKAIEAAVLAETKQVLAACHDLESKVECKFNNFPRSSAEINRKLLSQDWSMPWAAGGLAACQAVFVSVLERDPQVRSQAQQAMSEFYDSIADPKTGGYFLGVRPNQRMLVNGAMKVLTALDWLGATIHYPERLIDRVLEGLPSSKGCDLVDAVYVLYQCSLVSHYRHQDVKVFLTNCLKLIEGHRQRDGGFSYSKHKAQKWYYGMPISKGYREGDMHGTVLLIWALSMIIKVIEPDRFDWKIIRP